MMKLSNLVASDHNYNVHKWRVKTGRTKLNNSIKTSKLNKHKANRLPKILPKKRKLQKSKLVEHASSNNLKHSLESKFLENKTEESISDVKKVKRFPLKPKITVLQHSEPRVTFVDSVNTKSFLWSNYNFASSYTNFSGSFSSNGTVIKNSLPVLPSIKTNKMNLEASAHLNNNFELKKLRRMKKYRDALKRKRMWQLMWKWRVVSKMVVLLNRFMRDHRMVVDDKYNVYKGSQITPDVDPEDKRSSVEILFNLRSFRAQSDMPMPPIQQKVLKINPTERQNEDVETIQSLLRSLKVFADCSKSVQHEISCAGEYKGFAAGRVVVNEGKPLLNFYIVLTGTAVFVRKSESGKGISPVQFIRRGDVFGNESDSATWPLGVVTVEFCEFLLLDRNFFLKTILPSKLCNPVLSIEWNNFIKQLNLFHHWPMKLLDRKKSKKHFKYFRRGLVIVNNSKTNKYLYIVKSGACKVFISFEDSEDSSLVDKDVNFPKILYLRHLTKGESFGIESDLFRDQPQKLLLVSQGCECMLMDKRFYLDHVSPTCLSHLRQQEQPYMSEVDIRHKYLKHNSWKNFTNKILDSYIREKNYVKSMLP